MERQGLLARREGLRWHPVFNAQNKHEYKDHGKQGKDSRR